MGKDDSEVIYTGMTIEEVAKKYAGPDPDPSKPGARVTNSLYIGGDDLDPERVTRLLGVQPTRSSKEPVTKGVRLPSGRPNVIAPHWDLSVRKYDCYDMEEGLIEILDQIWPKREALLQFLRSGDYEIAFTTGILIQFDRPLYVLSPQTLSRMAYFEAEYGMDIHDFSE